MKAKANHKKIAMLFSLFFIVGFSLYFLKELRWLSAFSFFLLVFVFFMGIKNKLRKKETTRKKSFEIKASINYNALSILTAFVILLLFNLSPPNIGFGWINIQFSLFLSIVFGAVLFIIYVFLYILLNRELPDFTLEHISKRVVFLEFSRGFNEEIWFRGIILFLLLYSFNPMLSIILSTLLFTIVHLKSHWMSVLWALGTGFGFGFIMVITGNLVGPILGHALFNLLTDFLKKS